MVGRVADGNGLLNRQQVILVRGFESLTILYHAELAQLVEQFPRKEKITGSNPVFGT